MGALEHGATTELPLLYRPPRLHPQRPLLLRERWQLLLRGSQGGGPELLMLRWHPRGHRRSRLTVSATVCQRPRLLLLRLQLMSRPKLLLLLLIERKPRPTCGASVIDRRVSIYGHRCRRWRDLRAALLKRGPDRQLLPGNTLRLHLRGHRARLSRPTQLRRFWLLWG